MPKVLRIPKPSLTKPTIAQPQPNQRNFANPSRGNQSNVKPFQPKS